MTRPSTDHVICDAQDSGAFRCLHCGDRFMPSYPLPLAIFCESAKGYALMHKHCQKRPEPSKQVALFDELAAKEADSYETRSAAYSTMVKRPGEGIDCNSDDPAPEIDPPEIDYYDKFAQMYPMAGDVMQLTEAVRAALGSKHDGVQLFDPIAKWHPRSWQFDAVAHWARVELAHEESIARGIAGAIPGLTLPARLPMPEPLREILGLSGKKTKRGARPLSSGKRTRKVAP